MNTYKTLLGFGPLDFSILQSSASNQIQKRQHISLMKEISLSTASNGQDGEDQNFLDMVFGIGEVTEICGLSACGKSQICF